MGGLTELHRREGALLAEVDGAAVPRQYGDPLAEYRAATEGVAMVDRSHRVLLTVTGRAPTRMMTGVATGTMPPDLEEVEDGVTKGRATYSAILTPKGKVVTDLRLIRLGAGEDGSLLMDLPRNGAEPTREHLKKYMPPRFARIEDPDEPLGILTVVGPGGAEVVSREALGLRVDAPVLEALEEGEERAATGDSQVGVRVIRSGEVAPPALDLVAPLTTLRSLWLRFRELGVQPAGTGVWETLRIEKGRPAFGVELDPDTLPPEAGIHRRAIDHAKGCYTGQEVIVRIRDRGKVNRHLRGLLMGDLPHPEPGTPLFIEGRDRAAGEVRSAAQSPRFGQGIGLGYLRRELEPPGTARLGEPGGPELQVRALSDDGWVLAEGDPGRD
jgi:tRNA-modifying protein YgfZ